MIVAPREPELAEHIVATAQRHTSFLGLLLDRTRKFHASCEER